MSDAHLCKRYVTRMKKSNGIGAEGVHNRDVANVHNAIHGAKRKLEWKLIPEAVMVQVFFMASRMEWNCFLGIGAPGCRVKR